MEARNFLLGNCYQLDSSKGLLHLPLTILSQGLPDGLIRSELSNKRPKHGASLNREIAHRSRSFDVLDCAATSSSRQIVLGFRYGTGKTF
ncbi:hypothetical protein CBS11852_2251 [Aspergillus niger]|nr:hypothetical protein CBS11350_4631 [Aspergillus niger]KAI2902301.1 hypothetical protein CBS11852_2251 [Aspergillus niger]